MKQLYIFGQAYGEGAYGECTYSFTNQQCDTNSGGSGGAGSTGGGNGTGTGSGSLVDTGMAIAFTVTLACLLIFVALIVRFIRRPRTVPQEVTVETLNRENDDRA